MKTLYVHDKTTGLCHSLGGDKRLREVSPEEMKGDVVFDNINVTYREYEEPQTRYRSKAAMLTKGEGKALLTLIGSIIMSYFILY